MADGDALGPAGGAGGEDDPGVVLGAWSRGARPRAAVAVLGVDGVDGLCGVCGIDGVEGVDALLGAQHGPYPRLAEDQLGPLVGVLGVDRHIGGARGEHGEDRNVQLVPPGRHTDADPVTESHPGGREGAPAPLDLGGQRPVGQLLGPVVQGEFVGVRPYGCLEDVDQGAHRCGGSGGEPGGLAGFLGRLPFVQQSVFTALRCGCHRPSRLAPGNVRVARGARVCPGCSAQAPNSPSV